MPTKIKATPAQLAMFGHIAARLRKVLADREMSIGDFNEALGLKRGATNPYAWLAGRGAPAADYRQKLAALFDIPEDDLKARPAANGAKPPPRQMPAVPHRTAAPIAPTPSNNIFSFTVAADGSARLRLDVTMETGAALTLMRKLLDLNVISLPKGETHDDGKLVAREPGTC